MIPLIKGQRKSNYDYRDNLTVNMTAVVSQVEGDTGYLLAHDGLTEFAETFGTARGGYFNERLNTQFRVSGTRLEKVNIDGTTSIIGDIGGTDICSFSESFNTQAVVSNGKLWLYDGFNLTPVVDSAFSIPIDIEWFNNIYVLTDGESLYHSEVGDDYAFGALAYTSSEFATDPIKGLLRTDSNEIIAFNRYSTEFFYFNANAPTGGSVLQRINGKASRVGIVGTHCKCFLDGNIFILGGRKDESPSVHIFAGSNVSTIATREIDKLISQYTEDELNDVFMESRTVDRDKFILVHLPNETLLYNHTVAQQVGTGSAWTILKTGENDTWRGKFGVFDPRISKWVYGDKQESKLAYLDSKTFAQYSEEQECIFYTPIIPAKRVSINSVEIDTVPGYTAEVETCALSISYDGVAWGQEYWTTISKPNNYNTNYIVRRLGFIPQSFSLRFRFISADKIAASGLELNSA